VIDRNRVYDLMADLGVGASEMGYRLGCTAAVVFWLWSVSLVLLAVLDYLTRRH
jgi:hypothetical protein